MKLAVFKNMCDYTLTADEYRRVVEAIHQPFFIGNILI
jgi:hypothetical protein